MQHRGVVSTRGLIFCISSLFVLGLFVVPAVAQDNGSGPPPGTRVTSSNPENPNEPPNLFVIPARGCRVSEGASVTLADNDGTQATVVDGRGVDITATANQIRIKITGNQFFSDVATFPDPSDTSFDTGNTAGGITVVRTTGISCQGTGTATQGPTDQASDPIAGQTVSLEDNNGDGTVDTMGPIAVAGCTVDANAKIMVEDADGTRAELVNGQNATLTGAPNAITIQITDPADFETLTPGTGKVVSSTGIVCGDTGGNVASGVAAQTSSNAAQTQYNAGKVLKNTIPHKKILVDTGGPSLPLIGGAIVALCLVGLGIFLLRRT